jgi:hypothetical protein
MGGSATSVRCTSTPDVQSLGTSVARRVELTRSMLLSGTVGPGAFLPYRSERERKQRVGYDAFAKSSGDGRNLREAAIHCGLGDRNPRTVPRVTHRR